MPAAAFTRYAFAQSNVSLNWGGIQSVTVADLPVALSLLAASPASTTLTDFSVTSGSGTDYKRAILAVPEPATWYVRVSPGPKNVSL